MNQDQSQTGPVPQTAADLHAAVRGMPLPEGMRIAVLHAGAALIQWNGELIAQHLAELALEGWYSRMLDEKATRWLATRPIDAPKIWGVWVEDGMELLGTGPTKLHAMVAALRALGVGA